MGECAIVEMAAAGVRVRGATLLREVDLRIGPREHTAVLGPNGAGKTTLLRILSTYLFPSSGTVAVLGAQFGHTDLRDLRRRIGFVSVSLDPLLHARASAAALVDAAREGATWARPESRLAPDARRRAVRALARVGAAHLADRTVQTLSQGEAQRVRIARVLASAPELLLLDEPFAGLDLGARESLLHDLDRLLAEPDGPTVVLVTHHLEELPVGVRRAVLLREGQVVADGPAADVLVDGPVSDAFGLDVEVGVTDGRFAARARR